MTNPNFLCLLAFVSLITAARISHSGIPVRPDPIDHHYQISPPPPKEVTVHATKLNGQFTSIKFRWWGVDRYQDLISMNQSFVPIDTDNKDRLAEHTQFEALPWGELYLKYRWTLLYRIDAGDPNNHQLFITTGNQTILIDDKHPDAVIADTSEPINLITGHMVFNELDAFLPAHGLPLEYRRYYNSGFDLPAGPLGPRWTHSFDWSLIETTTTHVVQNGSWDKESIHITTMGRTFDLPRASSNTWYGIGNDNRQWIVYLQENDEYSLRRPGELRYRFDTNGVLKNMSDPWGNSLTYSYSGDYPTQNMTRIEHGNGQFLDFDYDGNLLTRIETPDPNFYLAYTYDDDGQLTNATRYTSSGAQSTAYNYAPGSSGILTRRVNALGHCFTYNYATNDSGQSISRATGMVVESNLYEHSIVYQTNDNISSVTYERGATNQTYDYQYDSDSLRITEILGPNSTNLVTSYTRDPYFYNLTVRKVIDYVQNEWIETEWEYDDRHNVIGEASAFSSSPVDEWTYLRDNDFDTVTRITDPEGHQLRFEYTNAAVSVLKLIDSGFTHRTSYSYDSEGKVTEILNANGNALRYSYDSYGFPTSTVPALGPETFLQFSRLGHLKQLSLPGDSGRRLTHFFPDELGRVTNIVYPDGLSERFEYDLLGNLTNRTDTAGRDTGYAYNPTRKLKSITRTLDSAVPTNLVVGFDYDQQFNTLDVTDERGRLVEAYTLDIQDRPITIANVEGQTMNIEYGVANFVRSLTRFDGSIVSNHYDSAGRLSEVYYPDQTNRFDYMDNGLLRSTKCRHGATSNTYSIANRLTATYGIAPNSSVVYTYFGAGQVSNMLSAAGTTRYTYDAGDRLSMIDSPAADFNYTFNSYNGLVSSMSVSTNELSANYKYDVLDRLVSIEWLNSSNDVLKSFTYDYDAASMITNLEREAGERITYAYDSLDRLTGETHRNSLSSIVSSESYTYDQVGNRLAKSHDDMSLAFEHVYASDGNRLKGWSLVGTGSVAIAHISGFDGADPDLPWQHQEGEVSFASAASAGPAFTVIYFDGPAIWGSSGGASAQGLSIPNVSGYTMVMTNAAILAVVTNCIDAYDVAGCVTQIVFRGDGYTRVADLEWNSLYQLTSVSADGSQSESYTYDGLGRLASISNATTLRNLVYDGIHVLAEVDDSGVLLKRYTYGPGIDNLLAYTVYSGTSTSTYHCITDHLGSVHALADQSGDLVEHYRYDAWGRVTIYNASGTPITASHHDNRHPLPGPPLRIPHRPLQLPSPLVRPHHRPLALQRPHRHQRRPEPIRRLQQQPRKQRRSLGPDTNQQGQSTEEAWIG